MGASSYRPCGRIVVSRPGTPQEFETLAAQAGLVFTGVVGEVDRSAEGDVSTAKVRIELIHDAPPLLVDYEGQVVDVMFPESSDLAVGERRVFFANPIEFAAGLSLAGVGTLEAVAEIGEFENALARVRDEERETALAERIDRSVAVVHGIVTGLHRVPTSNFASSEHDPQWWVAHIEVIELLKGEAVEEVSVRFANSRDIAWNDAPKLSPGQEAILILQDDAREDVEERLAVLAEDDVRTASADELELVRRLAR